MFSQQFYALGGGSLGLTPGDALLVYLSVYRYADACQSTPTKVRENLARLWDEVKILAEPHAVELLLEPKQSSEPLLSKLNIFSSRPSELRVVFLHEHNAQTSAWVRGQDKGRAALVKAFPDKLYVSCRENINPEVDAEQVLEEVAHDHADIVFTTSARMHTACLKVAAQHPKTRFLELFPQCAPSAGAHLLPPHLRGDLSAGNAGGHRLPQRQGGLCGCKPGVWCACGHQCLCSGRACRPARQPGGAALGLPVRCGTPAGFLGQERHRSLLQSGLPGAGRNLPRLRPLPPSARRRSAAAGPAGVAVGRVLHRDRPLRVCRDMGQRPPAAGRSTTGGDSRAVPSGWNTPPG